NLIMNKPMVKELIQHDLTPQNLRTELHKLLFDESERRRIEADYALLRSRLTEGSNASENAARIIASMFVTPTG
ncbi:MAG: lipid-A-disaccharide synthase, partial [Ferruginibacter sp.]